MPKVILNANENQYPVNDYDGKYGMSELSFGIPIRSKKQGDDIVKAINSSEFKEIIKATKWGAFQTDYKMFKYFKPDFYKHFLNSKQNTPEHEHESEETPESEQTPIMSSVKKTKCKKGTRRHKPMGPDCYSPDEISEWKKTQKLSKLLNKTKKIK